jgi:hypothetical protein
MIKFEQAVKFFLDTIHHFWSLKCHHHRQWYAVHREEVPQIL